MFKNTSKLILICLLLVIAINAIIVAMSISFVALDPNWEALQYKIMILDLMQWVWLVAGLILALKGVVKKETIDTRYLVSSVGLVIILLLSILAGLSQ